MLSVTINEEMFFIFIKKTNAFRYRLHIVDSDFKYAVVHKAQKVGVCNFLKSQVKKIK